MAEKQLWVWFLLFGIVLAVYAWLGYSLDSTCVIDSLNSENETIVVELDIYLLHDPRIFITIPIGALSKL